MPFNRHSAVIPASCPVQVQSLGAYVCVALTLLFGLGLASSQQQTAAVQELKAMLQMSQQKLAEAEARNVELTRQAAQTQQAADQANERLEALGIDLLRPGRDGLEQRLLKAVRDLDIYRQEEQQKRVALHQLSEAFLSYLVATPEAAEAQREKAQQALAKAGESLSEAGNRAAQVTRRLEKSQVISVDPQIGLVVLDAGRDSGVRVGTPITIDRDDQTLFTALIVDVRQNISGALLQSSVGSGAAVQVGDRISPLATQTNL